MKRATISEREQTAGCKQGSCEVTYQQHSTGDPQESHALQSTTPEQERQLNRAKQQNCGKNMKGMGENVIISMRKQILHKA